MINAALMSIQTISALSFAISGQNSRGIIEVAALQRLHDQLHDYIGSVAYSITGACAAGKPNLHVSVTGMLNVRCERCLEPFAYKIVISSNLTPVQHALPDLMDEDDTVESIPAEDMIDVIALVEEEILLSLPIAPRHETNVCSAAGAATKREQRSAGLGQLSVLIKESNHFDANQE
ncbi:MAG: YceD family protein [Burkholderiales bacterium]|nr:DUF177 domain-containing protein [Burkholderiales bacterium]MDQ3195877.1 DUF177 domain-containing protein [Pseudomonadota bacterium]